MVVLHIGLLANPMMNTIMKIADRSGLAGCGMIDGVTSYSKDISAKGEVS